jgi:hypothetical protein
MKKILLSLFALCATTSLWAFQSGLLYYNTLAGDSTVEVTSQTTNAGNYSDLTAVTIPETVTYGGKTYTVVAIGSKAFTYYPNNISSNFNNASLKLINIPKTVKTIGASAFSYCTALTTINFLGDGLESIGSSAFSDCSSLSSFNFPSTLKTIGSYAFETSALAGAVNLPDGVTSIGSNAFGYTKMTTLSIGNAVTTISSSAFYNCKSLTFVTLGNSVATIGQKAFYNCSGLTSVTLGNSVATIGSSAFYNCSSLTSITLPKSVKTINDLAFASCSKLTTVYLKSTTPPAFTNTDILPSSAKTFYVPCGAAETYFLSDWVTFTTNFQEEECIKKYTIYVNQDCTSSVVEE